MKTANELTADALEQEELGHAYTERAARRRAENDLKSYQADTDRAERAWACAARLHAEAEEMRAGK